MPRLTRMHGFANFRIFLGKIVLHILALLLYSGHPP